MPYATEREREREREGKSPRISIIIPVYNLAHLVSFGLDSLMNQTILHKDPASLEVIAVDDCSTDNSLEVLRRYEQAHPQLFRVIHSSRNRRQGGARNLGLAAAKGEWIGFMDADDWVAPDFCEKMLAKADATGADMVGCWATRTNEHSLVIKQVIKANSPEYTGIMEERHYKHLILSNHSLPFKIYKAEKIFYQNCNINKKYNIFPEGIFWEDVPTIISILCKSKHYELLPEPLYYYYENPHSTIRLPMGIDKVYDQITASKLLVKEAHTTDIYKKFKDEIDFKYISISYISPLYKCLHNLNFHTCTDILNVIKKHITQNLPYFYNNPYYTSMISREQRIYARLHLISTPLLLLCYKPVQLACRLRRLCILLVREPALAIAKIHTKFRKLCGG